MRHRRILSWAMTCMLISLVTPVALAFNYITVDYPDAVNTFVSDVNDHGQIVGYYQDDNDNVHGFLLYKGVFTQINAPGATLTIPYGINDHAQIVGYYQNNDGSAHGFLLYKGVFTTIDVSDANLTIPYGINDNGQIWGYYWKGSDAHGFLSTP